MIEGCCAGLAHGLNRPASVQATTNEYFGAQDLIAQLLEECCTVDPHNEHRWEKAKDLFASFKAFAESAREKPGSQRALAGKLQRYGLKSAVRRVGSKTYRTWSGASLKSRETHKY